MGFPNDTSQFLYGPLCGVSASTAAVVAGHNFGYIQVSGLSLSFFKIKHQPPPAPPKPPPAPPKPPPPPPAPPPSDPAFFFTPTPPIGGTGGAFGDYGRDYCVQGYYLSAIRMFASGVRMAPSEHHGGLWWPPKMALLRLGGPEHTTSPCFRVVS